MKQSVIQVNGFLSAGCAPNVEKALLKLPGVQHVIANVLNNTATVHYDESQVTLAHLQDALKDCGYICAGEAAPEHMAPHDDGQAAHTAHAMPTPAEPDEHAG